MIFIFSVAGDLVKPTVICARSVENRGRAHAASDVKSQSLAYLAKEGFARDHSLVPADGSVVGRFAVNVFKSQPYVLSMASFQFIE